MSYIASLIFDKAYFTLAEASIIANEIKFRITMMLETESSYILGPCSNIPADAYLIEVVPGLRQVVFSPLNGHTWKWISTKLERDRDLSKSSIRLD